MHVKRHTITVWFWYNGYTKCFAKYIRASDYDICLHCPCLSDISVKTCSPSSVYDWKENLLGICCMAHIDLVFKAMEGFGTR